MPIGDKYAKTCIHFNGVQNEICDAGLIYPKVNPCFKDHVGLPCAQRRFPTQEEVDKYTKEMECRFENMRKALTIVAKIKKEHKGHSWKGVETCPICDGKLHLTHSSVNGHVWGKCETENCLAWME